MARPPFSHVRGLPMLCGVVALCGLLQARAFGAPVPSPVGTWVTMWEAIVQCVMNDTTGPGDAASSDSETGRPLLAGTSLTQTTRVQAKTYLPSGAIAGFSLSSYLRAGNPVLDAYWGLQPPLEQIVWTQTLSEFSSSRSLALSLDRAWVDNATQQWKVQLGNYRPDLMLPLVFSGEPSLQSTLPGPQIYAPSLQFGVDYLSPVRGVIASGTVQGVTGEVFWGHLPRGSRYVVDTPTGLVPLPAVDTALWGASLQRAWVSRRGHTLTATVSAVARSDQGDALAATGGQMPSIAYSGLGAQLRWQLPDWHWSLVVEAANSRTVPLQGDVAGAAGASVWARLRYDTMREGQMSFGARQSVELGYGATQAGYGGDNFQQIFGGRLQFPFFLAYNVGSPGVAPHWFQNAVGWQLRWEYQNYPTIFGSLQLGSARQAAPFTQTTSALIGARDYYFSPIADSDGALGTMDSGSLYGQWAFAPQWTVATNCAVNRLRQDATLLTPFTTAPPRTDATFYLCKLTVGHTVRHDLSWEAGFTNSGATGLFGGFESQTIQWAPSASVIWEMRPGLTAALTVRDIQQTQLDPGQNVHARQYNLAWKWTH